MALLVIAAVILPVVAEFGVTSRQMVPQAWDVPPSEEAAVVQAAPVAPGKGGVVVRVGPGMGPVGEPVLPQPRVSPVTGLALPALGRLGGLVLNWLLWSGVLYVIGSMMGGRNTYGQMLHMVIWTWAPYAVRGVLQAGYIFLTRQPIANQGLSGFATIETTFAGVPTPPDTGALVWRGPLGSVDIYLFWHLALVVVGLMAVAHLPRRKAVFLALGSQALLTLLSLVPSIVLGSIAGMRMG